MKNRFFLRTLCVSVSLWLPATVHANIADSFGYGAAGIGMSGARTAVVDDWTSAYFNVAGMAAPSFTFWPGLKRRSTTSLGTHIDQEVADKRRIRLRRKKKESKCGPKGEGGAACTEAPDPIDEEIKTSRRASGRRTAGPQSQMGYAIGYQHPMMKLSVKGEGDATVADPISTKNAKVAQENLNYPMVYVGFVFDMRSIIKTPYNVPIRFGGSFAFPGSGSIGAIAEGSVKDHTFQKLGTEAERSVFLAGLAGQVFNKGGHYVSLGVGVNILASGSGEIHAYDATIPTSASSPPPDVETRMEIKPKPAPTAGIMYRTAIKKRHRLSLGFMYRGEVALEIDPIDGTAQSLILNIEFPLPTMSMLKFYTPHIFTLGGAFALWRKYTFILEGEYQMWSRFRVSSSRARIPKEAFDEFRDVLLGRAAFEAPIKLSKRHYIRPRFGYSFVPSFTPPQTGRANFLDNNKHIGSVGVGYMMPPMMMMRIPTLIDFGFQVQYWEPRSTTKDNPTPLNPPYEYSGMVFVTSLSFSWRF